MPAAEKTCNLVVKTARTPDPSAVARARSISPSPWPFLSAICPPRSVYLYSTAPSIDKRVSSTRRSGRTRLEEMGRPENAM
jgi:hypothetical protein